MSYTGIQIQKLYEQNACSSTKNSGMQADLEKAKEKNLDPIEVAILASIIDDEVTKKDDKASNCRCIPEQIKTGNSSSGLSNN